MLNTIGEITEPADAGPADVPNRHDTPGPAVLLITRGPREGLRIPLTEDHVTIGRNRFCDVPLDHVTVSRHHAVISFDGRSHTLTDTGSLNGTYHNRHPVQTTELADGDELRIGVYRLEFRAASG